MNNYTKLVTSLRVFVLIISDKWPVQDREQRSNPLSREKVHEPVKGMIYGHLEGTSFFADLIQSCIIRGHRGRELSPGFTSMPLEVCVYAGGGGGVVSMTTRFKGNQQAA